MFLQSIDRTLTPMCGLCKGSSGESQQDSATASLGTSTYEAMQTEDYQRLLGEAGEFFGAGPSAADTQSIDMLRSNLAAASGGLQDISTGVQDRAALNRAQQANLSGATTATERALADIGIASQGTGTAASARRGIAEGVAAADIYGKALAENTAMEADFQQAGLDRALQASTGLSAMTGDILGGMEGIESQSDYEKQLQNLLAYRDIISGDFGGTTTSGEKSITDVKSTTVPTASLI